MINLSRRDFVASSLPCLTALTLPKFASAAAGPVPVRRALPALRRLNVTCASRTNFHLFRRYSAQTALAGVVNVANAGGPFEIGTVFLYPWLKPAGQALKASPLKAALPYSAWASQPADFIPNADLPQDEFICRYRLKLPWQCFIGFTVDAPSGAHAPKTAWTSDVAKLSDGTGVAVDWTSCNLNEAWFGGSRFIPESEASGGKAWRGLILDALNQAAVSAC